VADYITAAMNDIAASLTTELRALAVAKGWPENLAQSLTMEVQGSAVVPVWDKKKDKKIRALEYGTSYTDPNPVIGSFMASGRMQEVAREHMGEILAYIQRSLR
jgi:hypothetical protein